MVLLDSTLWIASETRVMPFGISDASEWIDVVEHGGGGSFTFGRSAWAGHVLAFPLGWVEKPSGGTCPPYPWQAKGMEEAAFQGLLVDGATGDHPSLPRPLPSG